MNDVFHGGPLPMVSGEREPQRQMLKSVLEGQRKPGTTLRPNSIAEAGKRMHMTDSRGLAPRDRYGFTFRVLCRSLVCLALMAIAAVSPGMAQGRSPISVDVSFGVGAGGRPGPHDSRLGYSADALLGFQPGARTHNGGGFVLGVGGSGQGFTGGISCDAVPGHSCDPGFPGFWLLSALAGWETGHGGARFLVGPALARAQSESIGAVQARLDLARPIFSHFSLLASGRLTYVPRHRGDSFTLGFVGLGLRVH